MARLANRLQRKLLAQQNRAWDFDLEEGTLDAARLTRVITDPLHPLSFKLERDADFPGVKASAEVAYDELARYLTAAP